jgi:hypothetical protein
MEAIDSRRIDEFVRDGFVRLDAAFSRDTADACRELVWHRIGGAEGPVIRQPSWDAEPFEWAVNTPRLHASFDQLVGRSRWRPRRNPGLFVVRFPSTVDPGDAGWHIDGSFDVGGEWWVNLHSRGRALLMLFLFSDVGVNDAPTRILVGSHLDVPAVLLPEGDKGMHFESVLPRLPFVRERRIVLATGNSGDVYLCHPFLVHAASWPHHGTQPRFIAQPELPPAAPLLLEREDEDYSPVELAIRLGLGLAR